MRKTLIYKGRFLNQEDYYKVYINKSLKMIEMSRVDPKKCESLGIDPVRFEQWMIARGADDCELDDPKYVDSQYEVFAAECTAESAAEAHLRALANMEGVRALVAEADTRFRGSFRRLAESYETSLQRVKSQNGASPEAIQAAERNYGLAMKLEALNGGSGNIREYLHDTQSTGQNGNGRDPSSSR
jgi:hypothetical protein